jgi:hypothetical protein
MSDFRTKSDDHVGLALELIDYIFEYCREHWTEAETKANRHHFGSFKVGDNPSEARAKIFKDKFLTDDADALALLKNGFQQFAINTATRVYGQHADELNLNLCPECGKVARTPKAKQCRFCKHDWH